MCSENLRVLDVRFLSITKLDLEKFSNINQINLSYNHDLNSILVLEKLCSLLLLNCNGTEIESLPDLSAYPNLFSLNLANTKITNLSVSKSLKKLTYLSINGSLISNCDFLINLPRLHVLNISNTNIEELPDIASLVHLTSLNCNNLRIRTLPSLEKLCALKSLNISNTDMVSLEGIYFPSSLRSLSLESTKINTIPKNVTCLINLRRLDLVNMNLDFLPAEILDLELEFNFKNKGFGICLNDTTIKNFDISILRQPRTIVEEWFHNMKESKNSINTNFPKEVKVVFLGDGGSGKSLSIQRLLNSGDIPTNFDGTSTPGISINNKKFLVHNSQVLIRFWDFGGQEIMHSMHRMFLTKRTLYVVFVNARDNTQDERAHYWLHNIKSFANGSNVILVINQIDQNPSASLNEPVLRELYPQLKQIIKISAMTFSSEEFTNSLMQKILQNIEDTPYKSELFTPSWNKLKYKLQNMKNHYIDDKIFNIMCDECGVADHKQVRGLLLDWFSDLGISFCYRDSYALSNYLVLKPDWITNAIYIILFNAGNKSKNGLILHADIHEILKVPNNGRERVKRVIADISYSSIETEYVLGVIRKFRLSYRISEEEEFIPMLCDRNENPIAKDFTNNSNSLEFNIEYQYLPNNVLHRLMLDMRNDLNHKYVWRSGAIFASSTMGLSALIKIVDNSLKIYVKSESEFYSPNVYLGIIRNTITIINEKLGLSVSEIIIYKKDDIIEEYEYEYIMDSYKHGNKIIYSKKLKRNILITDILNQTDSTIVEQKNKLIKDMISTCTSMQSNKMYWKCDENDRNTYIRDMMRSMEYIVSDQTLSGKSSTGKRPGELDLEIRESPEKVWTIFEAINLKSFSKSGKEAWNRHLSKLLDNYNPAGLAFSFLVSYVECKKDDFKEFWIAYHEHLSQNCDSKYSIQKVQEHEESNFYVRSTECTYDRAGAPTTVYHICVRLGA